MTKTLKDFLEEASGILKVRNPDEQKFIDKHQVQRTNDRNDNDDEVFGGPKQKKVKAIDRRKDRHGYNPGEDATVYEALKGNQHRIDANKNGKIDAHDFKLLRNKTTDEYDDEFEDEMKATRQTKKSVEDAKKKYAKEEAEDLDEVLTAKTPMSTWIKDFQTSTNPKFKGKSQAKRREMAIAAKLSAERGGKKLGEESKQVDEADYSAKDAHAGKDIGKPGKQFAKIAAKAAKKYGSEERGRKVAGAVLAKLRKEDRLVELLSDVSDSSRSLMLDVFSRLNEDNQYKFISACETEEGVEHMLNFSILNRGK